MASDLGFDGFRGKRGGPIPCGGGTNVPDGMAGTGESDLLEVLQQGFGTRRGDDAHGDSVARDHDGTRFNHLRPHGCRSG